MARQNFIGVVVSQGKMIKTVKVRIEKKKFDARINKYVFLKKDYLVHDEAGVSREGDLVRIESTRPLSKRKFFSIAELMKNKGQQNALYEQNAKTQIMQEDSVKKLLTLDLESLKQKTLNKTEKLLDLHATLNELLQDDAKCNKILTTYMNVEDPESLKKNIKKNILRKYLLKSVDNKEVDI